MRENISTFAPNVTEVFAAVEVENKTKTVEFESKLFASKSHLSGLKENQTSQENIFDADGREF